MVEKKQEISKAIEAEGKVKSEWYIVEPSGKMNRVEIKNGKVSGFDLSKYPNLEKFALYEMFKNREANEEPVHISAMKRLQLIDYESGSDPGNFRFLPNGKLVKNLLEDFVTREMVNYGAMEVETPIMYDIEHPSLKAYLHRFPARQYTVESPNKKLFLRFSACFGQFLMAHETSISYRSLPMRMYEMTRYSFRAEQRGELAGLRRLRAFTMPDCHALCADIDQAREEYEKRFDLAIAIQKKIGFDLPEDLEFALRSVNDFWEDNKTYLLGLIKKWGKPALVEIWNKQFAYFVVKYEFNFVDSVNKAAALTTDQIDVENAKNYDIKFTTPENKMESPLILHLSPSGAIERVIYALLEKTVMKDEKHAMLPLWLSPTQVRICPMNDSLLPYCEEIADEFEKLQIRVDIDDRTESTQKKVRDAEKDWVPFTVVIGNREKESGNLSVRFRETGTVQNMSKDELIKMIIDKTRDMPFRKLTMPKLISKRPTFIG